MDKQFRDAGPGDADVQRRVEPQGRRHVLGLDVGPLRRLVLVCLQRHVQRREVMQVRVLGAQGSQVRERVRVRRVVGVHQDIARRQLGGVVEDGRFEFAKLLQNQRALLAAGEFDRVHGRAGFDGGMVGRGEGPGEKGVEKCGLACRRTAQDVGEEHIPLHPGRAFPALAGLGQVKRCGGGCPGIGGREAEVGEVGESRRGGEEGRHAPLGEPALEGDVAGFVADGGGGEGRIEPGWREAGGGGEEGGELGRVQAAVVVLVEEEEEVDEETVAGGREFDGGVRRDVEFGSQEAIA